MTRLTIRIDFDNGQGFGPGKARLLELIAENGSIRRAAAAMDMSYRHAWLLVAAVEKTFGAPAIATATGGAKGGGAVLTDLGRQIVSHYRAIEQTAAESTARELAALLAATGTKRGNSKHVGVRRLSGKSGKG